MSELRDTTGTQSEFHSGVAHRLSKVVKKAERKIKHRSNVSTLLPGLGSMHSSEAVKGLQSNP